MYHRRNRFHYCFYLCFSIALLIGLSAAINGCVSDSIKKQADSQIPLCLGMAYDVSGSVDTYGVPALQNSHLDHALSILKKRGGVMAFGLIDEKSFEPLDRLQLAPVMGRLDERARRNTRNQESINQFRIAVEPKISSPRKAKVTDFHGAMRRFRLFFNESTSAGAEKLIIIISDGIETGTRKRQPLSLLPDDVKVYAIGMEDGKAKGLFGSNVTIFESIDAAIDAVSNGGQDYAGDVS